MTTPQAPFRGGLATESPWIPVADLPGVPEGAYDSAVYDTATYGALGQAVGAPAGAGAAYGAALRTTGAAVGGPATVLPGR